MKQKIKCFHSLLFKFLYSIAMNRTQRVLIDIRDLNRKTKATDIITTSKLNPLTNRPLSDRYFEILKTRKKLPVFARLDELEEAVDKNQVIIVEGETGSGKTTQIPQALMLHYMATHPESDKLVCCTQPRRVAAINVAKRVAEEMDVTFGEEVGYTIRFDDFTTKRTKLKFMTDGMLQREAISDPMLSRYSIILLDEAHERTLATDIMMGVLKELLEKRPDLKLVVMSATLDASRFQEYFNNAPLYQVSGRTFHVDILYKESPVKDYIKEAQQVVMQIHLNEGPGDILVFLTGEKEINDSCTAIKEEASSLPADQQKLLILPLFSSLPYEEQQKAFEPTPEGYRKVVFATNIAETSITIDGIVYVVDCGLVKQNVYSPKTRIPSLHPEPISKASAKQRAGRAGRTREGKCYRLYTEDTYNKALLEQTFPEILRSDISSVILTMLKLGISNLVKFVFMSAPAPETMMRALETLNYLGALDDTGKLTDIGEKMAELPLDPQLSRALLASKEFHCVPEMLSITAMLSVQDMFVTPNNAKEEAEGAHASFTHPTSDHIMLLRVYDVFVQEEEDKREEWCNDYYINYRTMMNAMKVRGQLEGILQRFEIDVNDGNHVDDPNYDVTIRKCICSGFFMQAAVKEKTGSYTTMKDNIVVGLNKTSGLNPKPKWVIFNSVKETAQVYMKICTAIDADWLIELAPKYYDMSRFPPGTAHDELMGIIRRRQMGSQDAHRAGFLNPKRRRM